MKRFLANAVFVVSFLTYDLIAQPFALPAPEGWGKETIPFPIEFATDIPYVGTEEVRFTPGWGDSKSEEYWSYSFLWWINEDAATDAVSLSNHLKSYYSGLVGRNIIRRKIEQSKIVPTLSHLESTSRGNANYTYEGTVTMLDYMEQKPITLFIKIHQSRCEDAKKKILFIEVSPQGASHHIWEKFESIWKGFQCKP